MQEVRGLLPAIALHTAIDAIALVAMDMRAARGAGPPAGPRD